MDYKQHKGTLRGKIKDKVERKLYNKRIRLCAKDKADTNDIELTVPVIRQRALKWWDSLTEIQQKGYEYDTYG